MDRIGKGLRGAAYGLRQALDTIGAFLGPLAAIALMLHFAGDFWLAAIPAGIAVLLIVVGVREPETVKKVLFTALDALRDYLSDIVIVGGWVPQIYARSRSFVECRAHGRDCPTSV